MTKQPTHDQLFNVLHPGPAILRPAPAASRCATCRPGWCSIQWLFGDVTGTYDATTVEAVRGFQAKREIPVTGEVDQRTLDRLHAMTYQPTYERDAQHRARAGRARPALPDRPRAVRRQDLATRCAGWSTARCRRRYDVRFGSDELPTREGAFSVSQKSRDHVSSLYDTSMPFAMFFSGGQAVHYSPDFAATGYNGASHGCVNVRDYDGIALALRPGADRRQGDRLLVVSAGARRLRRCRADPRRRLRSRDDQRDPRGRPPRWSSARSPSDLDDRGSPARPAARRPPGHLAAPRRGSRRLGRGRRDPHHGRHPVRRRGKWWAETTAHAVVRDEVNEPGTGLVCFGSFAFADEPGDSVLVVPEVVVGRRGDITWLTTISRGALDLLDRARVAVAEPPQPRSR